LVTARRGLGRAAAPPSPLLAVPNVTAHPSTASVPITALLYDGPLLCGFNVAIIGLIAVRRTNVCVMLVRISHCAQVRLLFDFVVVNTADDDCEQMFASVALRL